MSRERLNDRVLRFEVRLRELADERRWSQCDHSDSLSGREQFGEHSLWDQLLYESIMECLGYAKNRRPMRALAREMRLEILRSQCTEHRGTMEALLLGAAGLLPSSRGLPLKEARREVRCLRRRWREIRTQYRGPVLHEADWLFFRLRPANFPTARLAAMAGIISSLFGGGFGTIVELIRARKRRPGEQLRSLLRLFSYRPEGFWSTHMHFRASAPGNGVRLGRQRVLDILVNAVIPLALLYGRVFTDLRLCRRTLTLYASVPRLQENGVTVRMRGDLVRGRFQVRTAKEQQGLLQLYNRYCTRVRCSECMVGSARGKGAEGEPVGREGTNVR